MILRPAAFTLAAAVALAGCESSQGTSQRLKAQGKSVLTQGKGLSISAENPDVRVLGTTVLQDKNGIAAVVRLRNTSRDDQAKVPIAITLKDAKGAKVYANDIPGLEASLTSMPLLPGRKESF